MKITMRADIYCGVKGEDGTALPVMLEQGKCYENVPEKWAQPQIDAGNAVAGDKSHEVGGVLPSKDDAAKDAAKGAKGSK